MPRMIVDHQRRERFAIHVFSDDQQRLASLGYQLQYRQQFADIRNLLVMQQDKRIFQQCDLPVRIVYEIRRKVAAVELHAFDDFQFILQSGTVFHRNNAFLANFFHRVGDDLANFRI